MLHAAIFFAILGFAIGPFLDERAIAVFALGCGVMSFIISTLQAGEVGNLWPLVLAFNLILFSVPPLISGLVAHTIRRRFLARTHLTTGSCLLTPDPLDQDNIV